MYPDLPLFQCILIRFVRPFVAWRSACLFGVMLGLGACSSSRFLEPGERVLSSVKVTSDVPHFKTSYYRPFVRQEPNAKWFNLAKVPLGIYCLSKADSVKGEKGFSGVLRRVGEAPVVYDEQLAGYSALSLEQALKSMGYLHAQVDTIVTQKRHKVAVDYRLHPAERFYVHRLAYTFDDSTLARVVRSESAASLLKEGMPLNLNTLVEERSRIVTALHNRGYYFVNNDFISFEIDTVAGSLASRLTLCFAMPVGADSAKAYVPQRFQSVNVYEDCIPDEQPADSSFYRGLTFFSADGLGLKRRTYVSHIGIAADSLYRESLLQSTYGSLNALPAVSFTTVMLSAAQQSDSLLDCNILVRRNKPHSLGVELEGTNTSGDLGAAVALSYSNRNLFRGSEQLTLKLRGAYEAITGLEGYANQNYVEWSAEANLRFPTLLIPFIDLPRKRNLKASSEARFMYNSQDRPEFHRRVLTGAWSYAWSPTSNPNWQHRYDLFSVNYVYMPWISDTFQEDYLEGDDPHYAVLRYSYEDLFILKTGYSFSYNSLRDLANRPSGLYQTNGYQVKFAVELAGNFLYAMAKAASLHKDTDGSYNLFGIAFSQYAKFDFDFAKSFVINEKNSLAMHIALGIGLPYGNSTILPYEKRYFAGGANSVRGWSVRELGPGSYKEEDGNVNFVNQTGNLKLDLSIEYRTFLFWQLHGAFFVDAGNVWNTRSYSGMEGGLFKFNRFYKQIAVAYGLGLRLNFDYFILRLDGGMKAINPAVTSGKLHYPVIHPDFSRDFTLHFAVGLPF